MPRHHHWVYGKCGIREFYFDNEVCPWKTASEVKVQVGGVVRINTMPESCWYNGDRYILKYHPGGDDQEKARVFDYANEIAHHPQCALRLTMAVMPQVVNEATNSVNDPRGWGFSSIGSGEGDEDQVVEQDADFSHHMDNAQYMDKIRDAVEAWEFVRPQGWPGEGPPTKDAIPEDLDGITEFETVPPSEEAAYIKLGPRLTEDGNIVYDEDGQPEYLEQLTEEEDEDHEGDPRYCNSTIYSDTMKWIRFKKPGKYMVVYVDLRMGKCVCGIHYDMRGMKRMISDDRYVLVEVTLPGRS